MSYEIGSHIITSYRDLNTVKFKVIHELEQQMPAALYAYEWQTAEEVVGKTYQPLSHLERWTPAIFIVLYVLLAIIDTLGCTRPAGYAPLLTPSPISSKAEH